jgi:hypothetical protein
MNPCIIDLKTIIISALITQFYVMTGAGRNLPSAVA